MGGGQQPMLALANLASASLRLVKPVDRIERVKTYARERMRAEVDAQPRGGQAELARKLGVSTAHIANMLNRGSGPGHETLEALAQHWGLTYSQMESKALGVEPKSSVVVVEMVPDRLQQVIVKMAKAGGYDDEVLSEALRTRALQGASTMTEAEADELLQLTRSYLRSARRIVATTVKDSGGSALDDLGGGLGSVKKTSTKRR